MRIRDYLIDAGRTQRTTVASDDRRLHPLSWLFAAAQVARGFVVPAIVVLFASGESYELWALAFAVPVAIGAVLQYAVFRYRLADDEIVVRDGLLTRTERHIPYARIQNVDLVQNPLHRLLRVALVRVETASGSKPEAVMRVLSLDAVDEMRDSGVRRPTDAGRRLGRRPRRRILRAGVLLRLPIGELVKLGTISNRGLVVVGARGRALVAAHPLRGPIWAIGPLRWWSPSADRLPAAAAGPPMVRAVAGGSRAAAGRRSWLLRICSIGWYVLQLHDFTLRRKGSDLAAEYGLLTRVSRTIPTSRVQSLRTTESLLHRWFGRQSVELRTAGGGDSGPRIDSELDAPAGGAAQGQWLAPLVEGVRVPALVAAALPGVALESVRWVPVAPRAWRRVFVRWVGLLVLPASLLAAAAVSPWLLLLAVPGRAPPRPSTRASPCAMPPMP